MKKKVKKRAVVYVRSAAAGKGAAEYAREQEKQCREFADKKGYEVVKVFDDTGNKNREARDELIKYCAKASNGIEALIVTDLSRLIRTFADHIALQKALEDVHLVPVHASELTEVGERFHTDLVTAVVYLAAQQEREARSERIKLGLRNKKLRKNS